MGKSTLILDTMGAELGVREMIRGAAQACGASSDRAFDLLVVATDRAEAEHCIATELAQAADRSGCSVNLVQAEQALPDQFTSPVDVYKKHPKCSIRIAMDHARDIANSAVISPGTTGLVMTSALFTLGRLPGIERPPIGTPMPTRGRELFFVDGGSNVDCRPAQLYQFAVLAHLFVKNVRKVEHPSIALLSNGTEEYKGNTLVREAALLLETDKNLNFVGFTEGHTLFAGDLDIMVCDGFVGNILLKFAEGAAEMIVSFLREEIKNNLMSRLAARIFQRRALRRFAERLDYTYFGGAPLLGLNGNVIVCHGRSPARAIKHALLVGYEMAQADIASQVAEYVGTHPVRLRTTNGEPQTAGNHRGP